jgi:hypothetical protein
VVGGRPRPGSGTLPGAYGIIRAAGAGLASLLVTACTLGGGTPPGQGGTTARQSPPAEQGNVWVLPPVGLNVHSQASDSSSKVTTLGQGAQIRVVGSQRGGGQTWMHVKSSDQNVDGWLVDDPRYVIHREVANHSEPNAYSMLYPSSWGVQAGNPAAFAAPAGDQDGGTLLVQFTDDPAKLPAIPTAAGTQMRQEAIEIGGIPTSIYVYRTNSGGYEYAVQRKLGKLAYFFDLKQTKSRADTTLFKQLLASVSPAP